MAKRIQLSDRFWPKVRCMGPNECWQWVGARSWNGYGRISFGVKRGNTRPVTGAHRASWQIHNGPIPPKMAVCHHCDNRICVNPAHLFLGTQKQNLQDAVQKGRREDWNGEKNINAKLTAAAVMLIREAGYTVSMNEWARRLGVSRTAVGFARQGKTWKRIEGQGANNE